MLLNESQPRPPRISQHQQGAGDLQIKHSDYLCPPLTAPPPVTLLSIAAHTKREGTHRTVVMIWGIKVFLFFVFPAELEGRVLHIPRLVLYHVIGRYPPELLTCGTVPFINIKSRQGRIYWSQGLIMGPFIMPQLHKSHYGAMESQDPVLWYEPHQIWDLSCMMKTQSRLHIAQKLQSRCALNEKTTLLPNKPVKFLFLANKGQEKASRFF